MPIQNKLPSPSSSSNKITSNSIIRPSKKKSKHKSILKIHATTAKKYNLRNDKHLSNHSYILNDREKIDVIYAAISLLSLKNSSQSSL